MTSGTYSLLIKKKKKLKSWTQYDTCIDLNKPPSVPFELWQSKINISSFIIPGLVFLMPMENLYAFFFFNVFHCSNLTVLWTDVSYNKVNGTISSMSESIIFYGEIDLCSISYDYVWVIISDIIITNSTIRKCIHFVINKIFMLNILLRLHNLFYS